MWLKLRKALYCLLRPKLWRALLAGVAPSIEHTQALAGRSFETIIDVGANRGQFALFVRLHNPCARIYAFEPLKEPSTIFRTLFAQDRNTILEQIAIGAATMDSEIYVAAADDSSSLLKPAINRHDTFATNSRAVPVTVRRLDDIVEAQQITRPSLLKIDVEGYERQVLAGSESILRHVDMVYVECSYVELGESQALASEIIEFLRHKGFLLAGVFNQMSMKNIGPVQGDFLFLRDDKKLGPEMLKVRPSLFRYIAELNNVASLVS
ncbi:MAG TPA: FkbM family methyltransferase [Terriglobales bacterium]|nr:FkbM family methyltransferase [Terriglobales bacterium]